jgi:hypothetical protein
LYCSGFLGIGVGAMLGGGYLMARGMENMRTGYQEWRTGQQQSTWFVEAGRRTAKGVGAENSTAENVGSWTELGASVVEFFLTWRAGGKIKEWQKQPPKMQGPKPPPKVPGRSELLPGERMTKHGAEKLADPSRHLSAAERAALRRSHKLRQTDGATVYIQQVEPGKFNVLVEGENGVIDMFRHRDINAIRRLAINFGWAAP